MKQVKIFDGRYAVLSDGSVLSLPRWVPVTGMKPRFIKGRRMKFQRIGDYDYVMISCGADSHEQYAVHRIVCEAFHGKPPKGKNDVNHIDCNKLNNNAKNLEWASRTENQLHAANNGLKPVGIKSHLHKLSEAEVHEIRALKGQMFQRIIAKKFNISQTQVSRIHRNTKWKQLKWVA